MYILELNQEGMGIEIGLFDTIEQGREFISKLEGYKCEEEDGFIYESIQLDKIPDYLELEFNNHIIPFTKFMFIGNGRIDIIWKEISNLSTEGNGIVPGCTRVDAYSIENNDLKEYIEKRERKYEIVKQYLEKNNFEVSREYFGSEDGEAILYRKKNTKNWHFLTHMDPNFCEISDVRCFLDIVE
ncbi:MULTISPECIES: hypothetical protein [Peptoniphilus]|uniref:hypothetical protein n=1 Tax=Peptoniphilus TaxID=162289 RepID=UPI0001DA9D62|nr:MULTISPECIES: hypothetical protein [Peptoniphilus]EFI42506.1 hypothetical protein HMPREF0629_01160 [Peptoniphilus sp. oral taxon 386 str. F0131]